MERAGRAAEAAAGAAERPGRLIQRLDCGVDFKRDGGANGGAAGALASDCRAGGELYGTKGWGEGID